MQFHLFDAPPAPVALELLAHASADYAPRTGENARAADATVAIAVDFDTHGERLTARLAGKRYCALAYGSSPARAADILTSFLVKQEARTLNVAGNGLYTLARHGITQQDANQYVYEVLRRVASAMSLEHVRSGGQTGIDTAGLAAAYALGIPATGLYPKGYRQRNARGEEIYHAAADLEAELKQMAAMLGAHR